MTPQQINMRRSGIGLIAVGAAFTVAVLPPLHPLAVVFLQIAYWPMHGVSAELQVPAPLLVAISGGLVAGLGAMFWALGTHVAPLSGEIASRVARMVTWTWFTIDSAASVLAGAPFNVVLNLFFLGLMLWSCRPAVPAAAART
jgi:hypothetical protein